MKKIYFVLPAILILLGAGCQKQEKQNAGVPPVTPPVEKNITITSPKAGETVKLPFVVKGQARVFESQFSIRVKNYSGDVLFEDTVMANAPDAGQFGPYEKMITNLSKTSDKNLILEAFDRSAKDGTEIDLVSVPIKIK